MTDGKRTVFVVDDDATVRAALLRLIRAAGYDAEELETATAYLQRAPPTLPACLVLDVRMPGIGGLELQERIRGTAHAVPIVFITGARRPGRAPAGARTGSGRSAQEGAPSWRRCRRGRASSRHGSGRSSPSSRRGTPTSAWEPTIGAAEATIKLHRARVMQKMKAESLADLVRMADRLGVRGQPAPHSGNRQLRTATVSAFRRPRSSRSARPRARIPRLSSP
jgi:CheY-like chemotaxis protein